MNTTTIGNFMVVDIRKPMSVQPDYDFCRVRKDYFDIAKKRGNFVLVRTPNGEKVFMPKSMKDYKIVKETFLFPDNPMSMYELVIPHCTKRDEDAYRFGS